MKVVKMDEYFRLPVDEFEEDKASRVKDNPKNNNPGENNASQLGYHTGNNPGQNNVDSTCG